MFYWHLNVPKDRSSSLSIIQEAPANRPFPARGSLPSPQPLPLPPGRGLKWESTPFFQYWGKGLAQGHPESREGRGEEPRPPSSYWKLQRGQQMLSYLGQGIRAISEAKTNPAEGPCTHFWASACPSVEPREMRGPMGCRPEREAVRTVGRLSKLGRGLWLRGPARAAKSWRKAKQRSGMFPGLLGQQPMLCQRDRVAKGRGSVGGRIVAAGAPGLGRSEEKVPGQEGWAALLPVPGA